MSSAIVWWAVEWGRRAALDDLHGTASASLNLYTAALRSDLEKYRAVAFVLQCDNDMRDAKSRGGSLLGRARGRFAKRAGPPPRAVGRLKEAATPDLNSALRKAVSDQ